jgi:hypothetical protein
MSYQKFLSCVLIATQFGIASSAFAADTSASAPQAVTPEMTLLTSVFAIQGQQLPQEQTQSEIGAAVAQYAQTASPEGQSARLEQALVDLKVYGSQDAQALMASAQAAAQKLGSNPSQQAVTEQAATLEQVLNLHPAGAQFSACDRSDLGGPLMGLGIVGGSLTMIIVGYYHYTDVTRDSTVDLSAERASIYVASGFLAAAVAGIILEISAGSCAG